jgi:hypothetical protein
MLCGSKLPRAQGRRVDPQLRPRESGIAAPKHYLENELRAELERNGLEVGRLEQEGRFLLRPEKDPPGSGREDELARLQEEVGEEGRTVWASFDWVMQVDLETALEQQKRLTELVDARQLVVKTAALDHHLGIRGWTDVEPRYADAAFLILAKTRLRREVEVRTCGAFCGLLLRIHRGTWKGGFSEVSTLSRAPV